ncbi:ABC transporter ATP-binding protein [Salipaludibacillus sp. LMS25]|jgi:putative ABC transport system ATP-binding protein|uniref:ABC transporter ATP-binding protein n=1 Tax=Salipaludibacillus sp. LMS25 TaxID=2924031 RepID=UPI0020D1CBD7|nr:ABC transporter ATP-binding protein [Salipaludibacillus sp. LMS25]UTR16880.1 ABC transporter ATP-binding protein [Salipaludibacillus sp. LMS25]
MIQLNNVCKAFTNKKQRIKVLDCLNLQVNTGEMIAIMGRSGAGKSTLLNIMAGLEHVDEGQYFFHDEALSSKGREALATFRREKIGFIMQHYPLIDTKNVTENVALPLLYGKHPKKDAMSQAKKMLANLDIGYLEDQSIETLSGGEAQRVAIARALIQDPELILADEPTGSLDEEAEKDILDLCVHLNRAGKTFIIVTHDSVVAERCHKIYKLEDGRCLESPTGLIKKPLKSDDTC